MMMKQLVTLGWALSLSVGLAAQEKFTEHLQQRKNGQGTVVVHHDAELDDLVNGLSPAKTTPSKPTPGVTGGHAAERNGESGSSASADADAAASKASKNRAKANGYRIQVYSGGNSREARQEAMRMGNRVRNYFADLSVYTHFYSPRWICRVGDFKTYEEANEMLRRLKETKKFDEAVIVRSKIVVEY